MNGPSLLTVKQVASALGIDERSVRDKLMLGTLKGTKKTVGQKEQWFVHQRDLDAELARRGLSPINQAREANAQEQVTSFAPPPASHEQASIEVTASPLQATAEDDAEEVIAVVSETNPSETERPTWRNEDIEKKLHETAEAFMKPLIEKVEMLTRESIEKDRIIEEQKTQLLLLPDLETQKAKLLREIEAERKAAEIQFARAVEKEEAAKALEEENAKLKQKAEEAALSAEKLQQLEKEILQLKQPKPSWWQRFFMSSSGTDS
jgi:hypothetical protein